MVVSNNIQLDAEMLLKTYPKTAEKIANYVGKSLISFQRIALLGGIPEESGADLQQLSGFDKALLKQACVSTLQLNPRMLYDIFDELGVNVTIYLLPTGEWVYLNNKSVLSHTATTRNQAETEAFTEAFKMVEEIL